MGEVRVYALKMMTMDEAGEIEKYLAWQLGIDSYDMCEFISGRKEATEALRQQIALLVKNLPHPLRPPSVGLKRGDQVPTCPACGAPFEKEWDAPFKTEMTYYAAACYCSVLHPEMATR
jgi:hypothetical protein